MSTRRCARFAIAQRQIVAIARALAGDAKVIFMDEPTSSLTQSETDRLLAIVRTLSAEGMSIVFVSHRLAEVLEISSRVTVLRDGKVVGVYPTAGMTQSRLTELMTGKTFDQSVRARDHAASPVVLRVDRPDARRRLRRRFADDTARRDARPDRPARRRPYRASAVDLRHAAPRSR